MIKDKYKKWELHKDSTKKKPGENDVQPGERHRNLKLHFFLTGQHDVITSLIDPKNIRPYINNYENARKIVFDINRDLYVNIEYESKMNMFLWKDIPEINSDDYLISEMVKFQDTCNEALQDLIMEISEIPRLPLQFRYTKPNNEQVIDQNEEDQNGLVGKSGYDEN